MKIYVFGNPLVKDDSIPLQILPGLKKVFPQVEFIVTDPNENFPPEGEKNLVIIDTVKGISKPEILDLDDFEKNNNTPISPHDYDLLFHLLLLKKLKKIESVRIIGIPFGTTFPTIVAKVVKIISSLLSKSERRRTYRDQTL